MAICLTGSTGLFTLLHTYFFGYSSWRCPSQNYPVSVPEVSILQIRTKRWEYTAWRDVGAQWNSRGAFTRYRPLWWNDHVMTVYMSSNSMKVISSQFWYLRSIPHHDPAKLHSTICILKYITFIHFCGIFCVVVVWKGSGSSPGHWLSLLSSKYSSIGNGFGDKPSFLSLWFHEQLSFFQFGDKFFVLLYERAVIALQDTAHLRWGRNMRGLAATVVTIRPCVINFSVRMEKMDCKKDEADADVHWVIDIWVGYQVEPYESCPCESSMLLFQEWHVTPCLLAVRRFWTLRRKTIRKRREEHSWQPYNQKLCVRAI